MNAAWKSAARRLIRGLAQAGLQLRSRPLDISRNERIVILSPHPDDDVLGCGGLIAHAVAGGAAVHVIYITDGSASHAGHPQMSSDALAHQRVAEAKAATAILGLKEAQLTFLGAGDGTLAHLSREAATSLTSAIASELDRLRPQTIALPCRADGSSEHDAVFQFAQQALAPSLGQIRQLEYPIWAWWNPLRLRKPILGSKKVWRVDLAEHHATKLKAIACHRSQVDPAPPWDQPLLPGEFVAAFHHGTEYFFET